jgi:hypothetical protein
VPVQGLDCRGCLSWTQRKSPLPGKPQVSSSNPFWLFQVRSGTLVIVAPQRAENWILRGIMDNNPLELPFRAVSARSGPRSKEIHLLNMQKDALQKNEPDHCP